MQQSAEHAEDSEHAGFPTFGGAGSDEVTIVPWPYLLRRKVVGRVERGGRYQWWVLWTVLFGLFSVNVTITILAVALSRIARDLHTTSNTLTWVLTAPLLLFGVAAPAMGKAGDMWGHRRIFLFGMAGAVVCAVLTPFAWSASSLIAVRALGGIEGAATGASSMAIIFAAFDRNDRVKAMGYWSLVGAGGPVLGVVIGGPVIEHFGWKWIFVCQIPLTSLGLLGAVLVVKETERQLRQRFDVRGAVLLTLAVTGVLFALNRGSEWGWSSPAVVIGFALGPVFIAAFLAAERRAEFPIIPLDYLRRRNFAFPIATQVFSNFAYMGGFILAPLLLANVFGYGPTRIGLMVIARPLMFSITAPIGGYFALRVGERVMTVVGTLCVVGSMFMFAAITQASTDLVIIAALALSGVGLGVSSPSAAACVANAVEDKDLGIASAAQQLLTQVGLVAGIQLMETIQASRRHAVGLVGSFHEAYLFGAAVCCLGVICATFVRSSKPARR